MAEPQQVNKEQLIKLQDYLDVFGSEKGQRVLEHMRKEYGGSCFNRDPIIMAFLNGQRQFLLDVEHNLRLANMEIELIKEDENGDQFNKG